LKASNISHRRSDFYVSGVTVRSKIEHGIIFGALHRVIQDSHLENLAIRTPSLAPSQQRFRIDGASGKTESKNQHCRDTKRAHLVNFNYVGQPEEQNLANTPNTMMQDATKLL
jgi:hypothetical protein